MICSGIKKPRNIGGFFLANERQDLDGYLPVKAMMQLKVL